MKNTLSVFIFSSLLSIWFFGCFIFPADKADIIVENTSDYEVMDITIKYNDIDDERIKFIDILQSGKSKKISVVLQEHAVMTFTTHVYIEYYINEIKYDINNQENPSYDVNGIPYSNESYIGGGNSIKFIIKNEGYSIENIRR